LSIGVSPAAADAQTLDTFGKTSKPDAEKVGQTKWIDCSRRVT